MKNQSWIVTSYCVCVWITNEIWTIRGYNVVLLRLLQGNEETDKSGCNGGKTGKTTGNHYSVRISQSQVL